jgi:hypothetical protein
VAWRDALLGGASKCLVFGAVPCGESVERSASDDRYEGGCLMGNQRDTQIYEIVGSLVKLIRCLGAEALIPVMLRASPRGPMN